MNDRYVRNTFIDLSLTFDANIRHMFGCSLNDWNSNAAGKEGAKSTVLSDGMVVSECKKLFEPVFQGGAGTMQKLEAEHCLAICEAVQFVLYPSAAVANDGRGRKGSGAADNFMLAVGQGLQHFLTKFRSYGPLSHHFVLFCVPTYNRTAFFPPWHQRLPRRRRTVSCIRV